MGSGISRVVGSGAGGSRFGGSRRRVAVAAAVGAVVLAGAGTATALAVGADGGSHDGSAAGSGGAAARAIPVERAMQAALARVPGPRLHDADLDFDNGRLVWDTELIKDGAEHDVVVDARSGSVISAAVDSNTGDDAAEHADDAARLARAKVDARRAAATASAAQHGRAVTKIELEGVRGGDAWKVKFERGGPERAVLVDASDATVRSAPAHGGDDEDEDDD